MTKLDTRWYTVSWTPCGRVLRNGLHKVCVKTSVFEKENEIKLVVEKGCYYY